MSSDSIPEFLSEDFPMDDGPPRDAWEISLRDFLTERLDGQVGGSVRRFLALDRPSETVDPVSAGADFPRPDLPGRGDWSGKLAWGWLAATAVSLGLVLMWRGSHEGRNPSPIVADSRADAPFDPSDSMKQGPSTLPTRPLLLEHQVRGRVFDEGVVDVPGAKPMRKLRRQRWERVEWYDPERHARVEMIVPREEVVLVALPIQ